MVQAVIIFDTETSADSIQRLNFGFCRVGFDYGAGFRAHTEICFYADDLPDRDVSGFHALRQYARKHRADISPGENANPRIVLLSRTDFVNKWLWPLAYKKRATVVGFNLPFDLSRLAVHAGAARGAYDGGFSLQVWGTMRPRICYKPIDSKKAFIGFTRINTPEGRDGYRGRFLDLRTLTHALTGTSHSLKSACAAYGVDDGKMDTAEHGRITADYIEYARHDVRITSRLYTEVMEDYRAHDIDMRPERLFSPASLAKAYYRRMGITAPLSRSGIDDETMGAVMSSYFGGRAECAIRHVPVPVRVLDFTAMYPTVNALMGGWDLLTSFALRWEDDTEDFQDLIRSITFDACFDPEVWRGFIGIALVKPDRDMLPVRAAYSGSGWNLGVNRLTCRDALWYTYPDIIASVIRTGRIPEVIRAIRFTGEGRLPMRPVTVPHSGTELNPEDDMFISVVEKRQELKDTPAGDFLKVFANSGSYGIFAEMLRLSEAEPVSVDVYSGTRHFVARTSSPEETGEFCFPPLAACITGAARLMLAMLQRAVDDAGGSWAFCDTDSTAVVCDDRTESVYYRDDHGRTGRIPVLSSHVVERIRKRFNALNPYSNVPDILKTEYAGQCYAISAKRYALFHLNSSRKIVIDKASNHGLGHLLNPTDITSDSRDWISGLWAHIITGQTAFKPNWLKKSALSRYSVSNMAMLRTFEPAATYAESIKPANFVLIAHPTKAARAKLGSRITLYTSYESDPAKWESLTWINKYDERRYHVGRALGYGDGYCQIQTYGDVLADYVRHPESTFDDRYGNRCTRDTIGQLFPTTIRAISRVHIGKEGNRLDDSAKGFATAHDVCQSYGSDADYWEHWGPLILPILTRWTAVELSRRIRTRVSIRQLRRVLGGYGAPGNELRGDLVNLAATVAADELGDAGRGHAGSIATCPKPPRLPAYSDAGRVAILRILTEWGDRYGHIRTEQP